MHRAHRSSVAGMDGKGAIMDGDKANRDDCGRMWKEAGLFRSQQKCGRADVPYRALARIGRHEV
jgi:hypothetical protein